MLDWIAYLAIGYIIIRIVLWVFRWLDDLAMWPGEKRKVLPATKIGKIPLWKIKNAVKAVKEKSKSQP